MELKSSETKNISVVRSDRGYAAIVRARRQQKQKSRGMLLATTSNTNANDTSSYAYCDRYRYSNTYSMPGMPEVSRLP
jgi:hypothetical protein